ncbi:MAG TPA: response regulator [Nitrososphaeraceae archaeon]|nr:response regulator [Nitrososphaeraceae archaeon]
MVEDDALVSLGKLVSIVDDEQDITILFRDALAGINGITIFTFTDPIIALEHFQINEHAYVLVISDFRMPGLNGMELLKKIKEKNKFVRSILMTAFTIDDKIFHDYTKKKIIDGFVQKPVRLFDLIKEVDNQIQAYETQKRFRS